LSEQASNLACQTTSYQLTMDPQEATPSDDDPRAQTVSSKTDLPTIIPVINSPQQQQQQQQQQHLHYSNQANNSSLLSMEEVGSSIERYSSSSNESSPERAYRGGHVRALSSSAPAAGQLAQMPPSYAVADATNSSYPPQHYPPHPHHHQHILSADDEDGVSSPSKDKETKQYQQSLPFSFGGVANAPTTLVQPGLGIPSPYDGRGGQMTHLGGPMTPSIMSSRPLSPGPGGMGVGSASPRYGTSSYPSLHRIRIRFRSLVSSSLLLASVMFMLILAANYGSISSLDFGYYSSTARDATGTSQLEQQQQYDEYKPVPVASVGGGVGSVGLGLHENGGEALYGEVGEEGSTSSNFVIRRGAGGLRVASNVASTNKPPDHPDDRQEGSGDGDSEQNASPSSKDEANPKKDVSSAASTVAGAAAAVAAASDQSAKEKKRKRRGFPKLDSEFYASKNRHPIMHGGYPRLLNINHKVVDDETPPSREVELYPAEFSDNTQYYSVVDSTDDPRAERMEMRKPYEDEECAPMADWQTTYNPSCNGMHELDVENGYDEREGKDLLLFGTGGFWRNAWKLDLPDHNATATAPAGSAETFVLKTLKYEHNFEDNFEEHDRIDAVALERLTSSPHVINIYGFCGHSVISEYADGPRLGTLADKSKKTPLKRLEIARDIASGLADVHGIDGDDQSSFVHLDINPANVVVVGKTLKLNDFNIGIPLKKNKKTGKTCGFPAQYPNPQWRSPEESREQNDLTEKVDVFSLGHIFFRLICGHEPWNKLEPGGRPEKEEVLEKVKKGTLPFIPEEILKSEDREIQIIRDAMLKCYTANPDERPSARTIANELESAHKKFSAEKNPTTQTTSDKKTTTDENKAKPASSVAKKTTSSKAKASTDKKKPSSTEKVTAVTKRKLKEVTSISTKKEASTEKVAKDKKEKEKK